MSLMMAMVAIAAAAAAAAHARAPMKVYVDGARGDDTNLGQSADAPLCTLTAARDLVRKRNREHSPGAVVTVASGTYGPLYLDDPVRDSGQPGAPVVWQGESGGALVSGGTVVPRAMFSAAHTHASNVVMADLTTLHLTPDDFGTFQLLDGVHGCSGGKMELFFAGARMSTARFPSLAANGSWEWAHAAAGGTGSFTINASTDPELAAHALSWNGKSNVWAHGYW